MKHAANSLAYAVGRQQRNGFHVRKIVWGRLMARAEERENEEIRAVMIMLVDPPKPAKRPKMKINWVRKQSQPKSTT